MSCNAVGTWERSYNAVGTWERSYNAVGTWERSCNAVGTRETISKVPGYASRGQSTGQQRIDRALIAIGYGHCKIRG
jgi:hypothetical protein